MLSLRATRHSRNKHMPTDIPVIAGKDISPVAVEARKSYG